MKCLACLGLLVLLLRSSVAMQAVQVSQFPWPAVGASTNGASFAFRAGSNLLITALSYNRTVTVSGVDTTRVDVVNTSGEILVSAIISTNSSFVDGAYSEIIQPLVIPAGTTNFIRGYIWGETYTNVPGFWLGGALPVSQVTVAPGLDYLGCGLGMDLAGYVTNYFVLGGNFSFSVMPEVSLQIRLVSFNQVQLSWPVIAGDYVLHSGPTLDGVMTPVLQPPDLLGAERVVTLPIESGSRFFRLIR